MYFFRAVQNLSIVCNVSYLLNQWFMAEIKNNCIEKYEFALYCTMNALMSNLLTFTVITYFAVFQDGLL